MRNLASLAIGTSEDLMRNGAIGRAFDTDDVAFSPQLGRFRLRQSV